jgi:anti-sigma regulatory factor (Ser/Thr protein kinase)
VLRKQLRSWLGSLGCPAETSGDIVLAASEAAANSIEHGAPADGRGIAIVGRADNGTISLVIRDHGSWKEPGRASNRGRGLPIMRQLMDTVVVEPADDGTVVRMEVAVPSH